MEGNTVHCFRCLCPFPKTPPFLVDTSVSKTKTQSLKNLSSSTSLHEHFSSTIRWGHVRQTSVQAGERGSPSRVRSMTVWEKSACTCRGVGGAKIGYLQGHWPNRQIYRDNGSQFLQSEKEITNIKKEEIRMNPRVLAEIGDILSSWFFNIDRTRDK